MLEKTEKKESLKEKFASLQKLFKILGKIDESFLQSTIKKSQLPEELTEKILEHFCKMRNIVSNEINRRIKDKAIIHQ